ncbi:phosphoenolpyruvate--protein phosphotransferase [Leptospira sp. GIMC2001]|uniref:phosphoenolpyruvate--protein phosphotransferase n=1 Tax=Leptospira sp. GIMC2001 TaxID=1513297 RepID=UPI00234AB19F|nr:phosphoenolpyruvate--protein phosphotransferase [Leptospira sp. GIMC2001]WCL50943.1 phosphoenolpyruvate--protein phosphotransferase [Leptospira sp. GIMC2001]
MVEEKSLFTGISAYPGSIYARCKKIQPQGGDEIVLRTGLSLPDRQTEEELFYQSLDRTENEINSIIHENENVAGSFELIEILNSQKDMLRDPLLVEGVLERIRELGDNAGLAVENTIQRIYEDFLNLEDEFFRERADHIQDIGKRISKNLYNRLNANNDVLQLNEPVILIAKDLTPSEMISLDKTKVLGIATDHGGKTGHMAIIARNYGIPTIVGLKNISSNVDDGEFLLLDADRGFVKRFPDIEELKLYGPRSNLIQRQQNKLRGELKTLDGERIVLKANLETASGCEEILEKKAEGVGLFRSEVLFLETKNHNPTEEEQFRVYKKILQKMNDKPVVIRVFDIGADKYEVGSHEDNPFLGNRGIRYLLRHSNFFKEQLRALLRASIYGRLQILLPMITVISEILKTKELIEECRSELNSEGHEVSSKIDLGIMVETPACAIGLEDFIKHVDFLSVGTNDLLQYLMGVDRNNYTISDLYNPFHIVFLQTLERIAIVAKKKKIPVSICGEIATDPDMTGILIAMGFRELSVSPPFLPIIQERIYQCKLKDEKNFLKKVKTLSMAEKFFELETLLRENSAG